MEFRRILLDLFLLCKEISRDKLIDLLNYQLLYCTEQVEYLDEFQRKMFNLIKDGLRGSLNGRCKPIECNVGKMIKKNLEKYVGRAHSNIYVGLLYEFLQCNANVLLTRCVEELKGHGTECGIYCSNVIRDQRELLRQFSKNSSENIQINHYIFEDLGLSGLEKVKQ